MNTEKQRRVKSPRELRMPPLADEDRCFCHLVCLCNYPQSEAYRIAYNNKARSNSNAAMASRRLKDPLIAEYLELLRRYYGHYKLEVY